MIAQSEDSIKTDGLMNHVMKKAPRQMFAVFKEIGWLFYDKFYRPILKLYPLKLSYYGRPDFAAREHQRCRSICKSSQSILFDLILYVSVSNNFSVMLGQVFLG